MSRPANSQIHTKMFRYPMLFGYAVYLQRMSFLPPRPRILSFGCSTGEELATLRHYFPDAELFGCDVIDDVLLQARAAMEGDGRTTVFRSTPENLRRYGPYDAVFANSVLCVNTDNAATLRAGLPFAEFEALLCDVAGSLAPEGVMFIVNASYIPDESASFLRMARPVLSHFVALGYVPKFSAAGALLVDRVVLEGRGFYRAADGADPAVLAKLANAVYTRSMRLAAHRIDYTPYTRTKVLRMPEPEGRLVGGYAVSHQRAGYQGASVWPTQDNLDELVADFLPELFIRIPGVTPDYVSLSSGVPITA